VSVIVSRLKLVSLLTMVTLAPGTATGEIQNRLNKTDWSPFSEADDFSWKAPASYGANGRITIYRNGQLISGSEPA